MICEWCKRSFPKRKGRFCGGCHGPDKNERRERSMWVYEQTEPGLWTVGYFDPQGKWHTDSDHTIREDAAKRCAWLNGHSSNAQ